MEGSVTEYLLSFGTELGFAALLLLFAASLMTVFAWFRQVTRGPSSPAPGARGLLTALWGFPSVKESWNRAWAQALNREALRSRSSVQMQFEESIPVQPNVHISHVTCTKHSDSSMVFLCNLCADTVRFPVSVTQESPVAVSCHTYQVALTVQEAQIEVRLQELPQEGLFISWGFKERPDMLLQVVPKHSYQNEGGAELCTVQDLIQNVLLSAQPAMMLHLQAPERDMGFRDGLLQESPGRTECFRLLIRQLHLPDVILPGPDAELVCEAEVDHPFQQKVTRAVTVQGRGEMCNLSWSDEMTFDLTPQSKELSLRVWQIVRTANNVLLGYTSVSLESACKDLCRKHVYLLTPSSALSKVSVPTITLEFSTPEVSLLSTSFGTQTQRVHITPTKKVEMDRTVMPDGTIVTTMTTVQSRLRLNGKIESPARSPSKVEVTENKPIILTQTSTASSSPSGTGGSAVSIKLDPVAETAIRQLTEPSNKLSKRTPTKRSTLIISGISTVPIGQDEMALSLGYAASADALLEDTTCIQDSLPEALSDFASEVTTSLGQDTDDATKSDISDRPSLDGLESETGSTGALETRSLKDHKVGFLHSGTKLLFRRRHKDAGLSQSHDDLSNVNASSRKKQGSFPRRLLKRFSLKAKSKSNVNGSN